MFEWLPFIIGLILTGVVAGLLAGMLGVGGGIVTVPVLFFVFQSLGVDANSAMLLATGTSLAIIVPTSLSSAYSHYRRNQVDLKILRLWSPFILTGALFGALSASYIGGNVTSCIFGVVATVFSFKLLFSTPRKTFSINCIGNVWQAISAYTVGMLSAMIGVGGATLGVPLLNFFNLTSHRSVGTAAAFGFMVGIPGALAMLSNTQLENTLPGTIGNVNIYAFILIAPLTVIMAPVGVRIGAALNDLHLKRIFAIFLCFCGVRMIYQSIM